MLYILLYRLMVFCKIIMAIIAIISMSSMYLYVYK